MKKHMIYMVFVNTITVFRIILTLILSIYITGDKNKSLFPLFLFLIIYLSDYFDGHLARKLAVCTSFGAVLDVFADLFFILSISILLMLSDGFPGWMLAVIIVKFIEFSCTSYLVKRKQMKYRHMFMFDKLGRKVAVLFYLLPCLAYLIRIYLPLHTSWLLLNMICISVTLGAGISSVLRIKQVMQSQSEKKGITSENINIYNLGNLKRNL